MGLVAAAMLATSAAIPSETAAPAWDDPETARGVPNVLVWSSTRTLVNIGYSATLWQKPFGAMYFAFSFGGVGPDAPGRYQVSAPEFGVKLGSPRLFLSAGLGIASGGRFETRDKTRYGMNTKLLLGVQPWRHLGFIGGVAAFSPIARTRDDGEQTYTLEGILGVQLGF